MGRRIERYIKLVNQATTNEVINEDTTGRILCLDLGEKRIGVAISDETRTIARSYQVFNRSSRAFDFEQIAHIIAENCVNLVVVGLPTLADGGEGDKATWTRDYASDLASSIGIPVELWDESYSTVDARTSLGSRGIPKRRKKDRIDAVAAAFILQSYLDAQELRKRISPDLEDSPDSEI